MKCDVIEVTVNETKKARATTWMKSITNSEENPIANVIKCGYMSHKEGIGELILPLVKETTRKGVHNRRLDTLLTLYVRKFPEPARFQDGHHQLRIGGRFDQDSCKTLEAPLGPSWWWGPPVTHTRALSQNLHNGLTGEDYNITTAPIRPPFKLKREIGGSYPKNGG